MAYIEKLSNEILKDILDHIESDPQRSIPVDRREYLSVESFRPPSPPLPSQAQDIGNIRLSCRRFAELGIPYQFTRVTLRFSSSGFQRLARICSHAHLAKHTKKFSYLVPLFYGESTPSHCVLLIRELIITKAGSMSAILLGRREIHLTLTLAITFICQTLQNFGGKSRTKRKLSDRKRTFLSSKTQWLHSLRCNMSRFFDSKTRLIDDLSTTYS